MQNQLTELQAMVQELCRRSDAPRHDLPEELFQLFTELLDSDLNEELARELVERVRTETKDSHIDDLLMVKARLARMIEAEVSICGPIRIGAPSTLVGAAAAWWPWSARPAWARRRRSPSWRPITT